MIEQPNGSETVVMCAHCGRVYRGLSRAATWADAQACVASHQIKTYRYAPELAPRAGLAPMVPGGHPGAVEDLLH